MSAWMLLLVVSIAHIYTGTTAQKTDSCVQNGAIRLRGQRTNATCGFTNGRVEICEELQWKRICDSAWTVEDATVVCRDLGYPGTGAVNLSIGQSGSTIAESSSIVPACSGSENQVTDCPFTEAEEATITSCMQIAGIQCYLDEPSLALCGGVVTTTTTTTTTQSPLDTQQQPVTSSTSVTTAAPNTLITVTPSAEAPLTTLTNNVETSQPSEEDTVDVTTPTVRGGAPIEAKKLLKSYHYVIIVFAAVILILIVVISVGLTVFCVRNFRSIKAGSNDNESTASENSESSKEDLESTNPNTENIHVPNHTIEVLKFKHVPKQCKLDRNPAYEISMPLPADNEVTALQEKAATPIVVYRQQDAEVILQAYPPHSSKGRNSTTSKDHNEEAHTYDDVIVPRIIQTEV